MSSEAWTLMVKPAGREDALWELFHENSKAAPHEGLPSQLQVAATARRLPESISFGPFPKVELPAASTPLDLVLGEAITDRPPVRTLDPCTLSLEDLAALLRSSYGVIGDGGETDLPRSPRAVPSAGFLYPLELFFHSSYVAGLESGIYHYNPAQDDLRLLNRYDQSHRIAKGLVDPRIAGAALLVFITAMPERAVLGYGDRGYRMVMLEAGAVVQNLNLVARALDLACINVGEYFDREIDRILGLDGLSLSTFYLVAIGKRAAADNAALSHPFAGGK